MWPWKKVTPPPVTEEFEYSISHSGLDLLMEYDRQTRELLWKALETRAIKANTKFIEREDVEKIGGQVIVALKQLIEEHE